MPKRINKFLIRIKGVFLSGRNANLRGIFKNPLFYYGLVALILFVSIASSCNNAAASGSLADSRSVFLNYLSDNLNSNSGSLFSTTSNAISLESPDLKIMQGNTLAGIAVPSVLSGKVLGDVFGGSPQNQKDVVDYTVQPGDTLQSVANSYGISLNTLLWANDLSSSSTIKVGQSLVILPVDGVLRVVKSGDTVSGIAQTYKAKADDIVSFNNLANPGDIYIGDILIVPGGIMPKNSAPIVNNNIPLADNYFIYPTEGTVTQGLHYYNAIDVANKCGTPIYAAASGVVQRAVYNNAWNSGMGNYVTILHANGTVTYYGHFETVFVTPGQKVTVGDRIGLMGRTGNATGCHVHFEVVGATNPLAKYPVGTKITLK